MASRRSSSARDSGRAHGVARPSQQPDLNPSARSFTPVMATPSFYSPPVQHHVELAYHQHKAAEAARIFAQARMPSASCASAELADLQVRKKRRASNAFSQSENAPSRSASAPNWTGIVDRNLPKTPPNQHARLQTAAPTPRAYSFDDDDEFYPGPDPRLAGLRRGQEELGRGSGRSTEM